jgi:SdpC family antimicrobial peptide
MQGFPRHWYGRATAVVTALLFVAQAPLAAANPAREAGSGHDKGVDGRTLYKALFQGRGPALQLIPEVNENFRLEDILPPEQMAEVSSLFDRILRSLDENDRGFFNRFGQALASHDHQTIRLAMVYAAEMTKKALSEMPEYRDLMAAVEIDRKTLEASAAGLGPAGSQALASVDRYLSQQIHVQERDPQLPIAFVRGFALAVALAVAVVVVIPPIVVAVVAALAVAYAYALAFQGPSSAVNADGAWAGDPLLKERVIDSLTRLP